MYMYIRVCIYTFAYITLYAYIYADIYGYLISPTPLTTDIASSPKNRALYRSVNECLVNSEFFAGVSIFDLPVYACVCTCIDGGVQMHEYTCACVDKCTYIYIYIYTYKYTYIHM